MPRIAQKNNRRQQILEALAHMLEASPGQRITTAGLAKQVGVSEAALYRHFPSKAKMFEGLIEFVEEAIFSRVNMIVNEEQSAAVRIERILTLLLGFAEKNPGICRILTDAKRWTKCRHDAFVIAPHAALAKSRVAERRAEL